MTMRNPNGYGTIYKLSGNRRKPFIVRVTVGWSYYDRLTKKRIENIPDNCDPLEKLPDGRQRFSNVQLYNNVGYYETRQDAMIALAEYNKDPFDLQLARITFEEVYDRWSTEHFEKVVNTNGYIASYKLCEALYK